MAQKKTAEMQIPTDVKRALVGRTIVDVRWMTDKEMQNFYWIKRPMVLECNDLTLIVFQSDDEGNDGGCAFVYDCVSKKETICYTR